MKESFIERAKENLLVAELAYDRDCFNASASRAYYAAFHAAIAAIYSVGINLKIDHKAVQSLFSDYFFNRRKILPSKFKGYLKDMQDIRSDADYKKGVGKKLSKKQLSYTKEFIEQIMKVI